MLVCRAITVHFTFQITPQKKSLELLGPANEEAMAHHRNEKSPAAETRRSAAMLITAVWAVTPSCWNHKEPLFGGRFGDRNSLIISVTLRCNCDGFSVFILTEVGSSDSSGPNSAPYGNFWVVSGALMKFVGIYSWPVSKVLLINCKRKCASSLIRSLFGMSGFAVSIPTNWRQNCKRISLSRLLKACAACNLYGWRLRSLCRMRRTLSDMRKAWAHLGLRLTDASTRAMFSGGWTEDGQPGGFLHVIELSSRHCLTHRRIAFGDGASCWFRSRRSTGWVSVIDPVRINSSTAYTRSLTPQRSMLNNLKVD